MAKSAREELLARIDADIKRLEAMRDYVTTNAVEGTEPPKARKPRGPGKKKAGLPATDAGGTF